MKKFFLLIATVLSSFTASAQSVTVVDDIATYAGDDAYVFSQKDGKTYVRNNLNQYEQYGVYVKTNTLNIASTDTQYAQIEYLKSPDGAFINLNYIPKQNSKAVAVIKAENGPDWKAVYGTGYDQGGWKDRFCFFTTNATINLGGETGNKSQMVYGEKIWTVLDATAGDLKIYDDAAMTNLRGTITDSPKNADCKTPLYVFAQNKNWPNNEHLQTDCYNPYVTLYSLDLYEGDNKVLELVPAVTSDGKAGLLDKLTNKMYTSANTKEFELSPDAAEKMVPGISVYEGKMVLNTTDGKIYKYSNGAFTLVGERLVNSIEGDYKNMKNWRSNDEHWNNVFGNGANIGFDESTGVNTFNPYRGTGGWEPLFYKVTDLEENADYNISFTYSTGGWNSWSSYTTLPFLILKNENFDHGQAAGSGTIFAEAQLPQAQTTDHAVSVDFTPDQNYAMLVVQFGVVDDGKDFSFNFGNWKLGKYAYPEAYPAVNPFAPQLALLIPEVEQELANLNTTTALENALTQALNTAKGVVEGDNLAAQKSALEALQNAFKAAKDVNITLLSKITVLAEADGVNVSGANDFFVNGTSVDALNALVSDLRVARKIAHIETDAAAYTGNEPEAGDFYLYNVGRKAYLTSGSDWGSHAALGYPGLLATLAQNGNGFTIQFNELIPGDARQKYLNGSPYVDSDNGDTYVFEAVSGKPGVYAVKGSRGYLAFDENGEVDGGGKHHFNTVTATWGTPGNPDAEWMLVSKADRLAQLENASAENPVDATVLIRDASFNKFAALNNPWTDLNQGWEWGNRDFGDKNTETFNSQEYNLSQTITLPRAGKYSLSVQSYYRDGSFDAHTASVASSEPLHAPAVLYAGDDTTPLMYIHEEADLAPGEGRDSEIGNYPDNMIQAAAFFETGLYWNTVKFEVGQANTQITIGIRKSGNDHRQNNWVVADNFRLAFLGTSVVDGIQQVENEAVNSDVIYNLQGVRVQKPVRGLYIQNGKKVIKK